MNRQQPTILIADDDATIRRSVSSLLDDEFKTVEAVDYASSLAAFENNDIALSILDINFDKERSGIDVLREIRKLDSTAPVIVLSAVVDTPKVVEAIKLGAFDYLTKSPRAIEVELPLRIEQCLRRGAELRALEGMSLATGRRRALVTQDPTIKSIMREIESVCEMNILIEGETGVGKTPVAEFANTALSKDVKRPFVRINCAGLSRERLQDELFGHRRGAFTGADADRKGLVELARDGDLFMDEIGDLDPSCQAELLMFLDSGEFRRLGDPSIRYSNCRIIAATNYDLKRSVANGTFRKDLYSRIAQCRFSIPPLRDRKGDIPLLLEHFIKEFCGDTKEHAQDVLDLYNRFDWDEGNVRELRDAIMYMCRKARDDEIIELKHVNPNYFANDGCCKNLRSIAVDSGSIKEDVLRCGFDTYLSHIEKRILEEVSAGEKSIRSLAKKLDVVDVTLHRKFKKHNITLKP